MPEIENKFCPKCGKPLKSEGEKEFGVHKSCLGDEISETGKSSQETDVFQKGSDELGEDVSDLVSETDGLEEGYLDKDLYDYDAHGKKTPISFEADLKKALEKIKGMPRRFVDTIADVVMSVANGSQSPALAESELSEDEEIKAEIQKIQNGVSGTSETPEAEAETEGDI